MKLKLSYLIAPIICFLLGITAVALAQRTNYLGTVFIADTTTPAQQLKVNADGSINVSGTIGTGSTVQPIAGTTGGATPYFLQPIASDNHATIKAGAGTAYGVVATNNSITINYLRLYDATTAFNGCNSATGLLTQVAILPSGGISMQFPVGMTFSTGLSICVTSLYATTDTTAATASAMSVTVLYK